MKKPPSRPYESLKGMDPKSLRNMCFTQKHKRGLRKMQANSTKAIGAPTEAIKEPKDIKAKIPMGINRKVSRLAYMVYSKLGKGLRLCRPKAQSKADASTPTQAPRGTQAPTK
ncbi:60S ribosomal protein L29-like [Echinops telfairi]|uniref:60S ribosomal protein L29-like n=1 Tax=Echinops telfairi TaxID=9371 RepID=A0AC55CTI0_ECHTE|nr:60S ribosomal protein L29-like [Echinops telfairi]